MVTSECVATSDCSAVMLAISSLKLLFAFSVLVALLMAFFKTDQHLSFPLSQTPH